MPLGGNRAPAGLITFEMWDQDTFKVGSSSSSTPAMHCVLRQSEMLKFQCDAAAGSAVLAKPVQEFMPWLQRSGMFISSCPGRCLPLMPLPLQDDLVGTAVLDLAQLDPSALSYLELPLSFEKPKHAAAGGQARLVLSVKGWVNSFGILLADTKHIPGEPQHSMP